MAQLGQPEAGNQGEQPAVCQRSRIVFGLGFAAESKGYRLGCARTRQVVGAIPRARQCQYQHRHERNTHRHVRAHCGRQQLQAGRTQPIGQQAGVFGWHARQCRLQPTAVPIGDFAHVRHGYDIVIAPGIPSYKASQDVDRTDQHEHGAGEPAHAVLGNNCRAGGAHGQ